MIYTTPAVTRGRPYEAAGPDGAKWIPAGSTTRRYPARPRTGQRPGRRLSPRPIGRFAREHRGTTLKVALAVEGDNFFVRPARRAQVRPRRARHSLGPTADPAENTRIEITAWPPHRTVFWIIIRSPVPCPVRPNIHVAPTPPWRFSRGHGVSRGRHQPGEPLSFTVGHAQIRCAVRLRASARTATAEQRLSIHRLPRLWSNAKHPTTRRPWDAHGRRLIVGC